MADTSQTTSNNAAIGEVQSLSGRVVAVGIDGTERQLVVGDLIFAGETIRTIGQSTIVVAMNDGSRFDLGRNGEAVMDESVAPTDIAALRAEAEAEVAEIQQAIAEGADPAEVTEEPAAGEVQGSAGESVQNAVDVGRTGRVGTVEAGFETSTQGREFEPLLADPVDFGANTAGTGSILPNQSPTAIGLDNTSVGENLVGAVVGTLTTTDPDALDSFTYTVSDVRFEVVDGQLKLRDGVSLDHEAGDTVTVEVTSTDAGGLSTSESFTIAVNDVNEAPTAIALDNLGVDENAAGAVIGALSTTDLDDGDSQTYSVDDDRFEVVDGQLKLKDGQSLDHEAEETVTVEVTSTDAGGLSTSESFTIAVNDVNEAPTLTAGSINADENDLEAGINIDAATSNLLANAVDVDDGDNTLLIGTVNGDAANVGSAVSVTLSYTDADGNDQTQDVALTVNADGSYSIAGFDLDVLPAGVEATASFTYSVTDGDLRSSEESATITITGTNDRPVAVDDPESVETEVAFTLGTLASNGTVGQWGDIQGDGTLAIASGNITGTVTGFAGDSQLPVRFDPRDGIEVGNGEIDLDEAVVIEFDQEVSDVNVTLDSLGGRFQNEEARVGWTTFDENGEEVSSGVFWGEADSDKPASAMETYAVSSDPFSSIRIEIVDATRDANFTVKAISGNALFDGYATAEDTAITFKIDDLLANDWDPDGDDIVFDAVLWSPENGIVEVDRDNGEITFTPNADYVGPASFSYTITDGKGGFSDPATVNLIVTSVNDQPVITVAEGLFTTDEDVPLTIDVDVSDVEDGPITPVLSATNGTAEFDSAGNIIYTPDENWSGDEVITVTATDSDGAVTTSTIAVTVNPVNDDPVAVDDTGSDTISLGGPGNEWGVLSDGVITTTQSGVAVTISSDVSNLNFQTGSNFGIGAGGNEVDINENVIFEFDQPVSNATIGLGSLGSHYNEGSSQDASVVWKAFDENGIQVATGSVRSDADNADGDGNRTTNIIEINEAFTRVELQTQANTNSNFTVQSLRATVENRLAVDEDATLVVSKESGVIDPNDTDVDGDALEVTGVRAGEEGGEQVGVNLVAIGVYGTLMLNPDGSYQYVADQDAADALAPGESAVDIFTYQISDGRGGTDTAEIRITVNGVNDAPVARDDSAETTPATSIIIDVLGNDDDPEGDALTVVSAQAGNGTAAVNDDGTLTYTPNDGFSGVDTIAYTVQDASGEPASASVSVTVNDPPVAEDDFSEHTVRFGEGGDPPGWDGVTLIADSGIEDVEATVSSSGSGLGITSASNNRISQIEHRSERLADGSSESSESLTIQFGDPVLGASFGYDRLFNRGGESGDTAEQGRWVAVLNGQDIAQGEFKAEPGQISGTVTVVTGGLAFDALRFEAITYADGSAPGDSSDYTVRWVEVTKAEGRTTAANSSVEIDASVILFNDSDPNGDPIEITSVSPQSEAGAAVSLIDGNVNYDPNGAFDALGAGEVATDWFSYTVSDGLGGVDSARVAVTVVGTETSASLDGILVGGDGEDILVGGQGDDELEGGDGADLFVWNDGDAGNPAEDVIRDFSQAERDVLDLKDLLTDAHSGNLTEFLHFDSEPDGHGGTNTVLQISSDGGFVDGTFDVNAVDQVIRLEGIDLTTIGTGSDEDIINALVGNNLIV